MKTPSAFMLSVFSSLVLFAFFHSSVSEAQYYHRHWRDVGSRGFYVHDVRSWHAGHWYHGPYAGHSGWWWIVGDRWHYYPRSYYPYPDPVLTPTYVIEVPSETQSPPPSTVYVAPPAPPAPQVVTVTTPAVSNAPIQMMQPAADTPIQLRSATSASTAYTYYCSNPRGYYPSVASCPGGWAASPASAPQ